MRRLIQTTSAGLSLAAIAVALLVPAAARADRRPPFGNDAGMLETRVREDVERRINPLLDQMAPGQADLSYVDVRVNRPTALATGTNPGFEDLGPGADFVAERIEINLQLDSKLPLPFRKDLKALIAGKLESLAVPIDIKEHVLAYPTPRPQPPTPREPPPYYPPQPQPQPAAAPAPAPTASPAAATPPARPAEPAGWPSWAVALLVATAVLLFACLALLAFIVAERRRTRAEAKAAAEGRAAGDAGQQVGARANAAPHGPDRLPEVRRALVEDRLLARRVLGEMLTQNELDKVARTVELVGPSVVDDLRSDPNHAAALRDAATRLDTGKAASAEEVRALADELYRRVLKHRMMGSGDPIEQEFAFLVGLPPARFAAILDGERPSARAAALRYAPVHLRTTYLDDRGLDERAALVGALADSKTLTKDYLMDVAATLRGRAIEQAHVGGGEASEVELLVEMIEDASPDERNKLLDAIGTADPEKRRRVQSLMVTDEALGRIADPVLGAAALSVPTEVLAAFLRATEPAITDRFLSALPAAIAAGIREDLSLDIPIAPEAYAEAKRAVHRALRRTLRERGMSVPSGPSGSATGGDIGERGKGSGTGNGNGRKVVAV
jgi:flagellar motor switch protein FliG